jgi:hypothetical protein
MTLGRQALILAGCAAPLACAPAVTLAAGAGGPSPKALYNSLLKAPVASSDLPHGYKSPVVGPYAVTSKAKSHHAIGGVQIEAENGNVAVIYIIFATKAAAKADWASANLTGTRTQAAPSSVPKPSIVVNTSASGMSGGKKITFGLTDIACLYGNVIVQAATSSLTSTKHGDLAGAVALERFALKHLDAVQGPSA